MSFTFNMVGGGAANLFAAIGVTYPAGSVLTCTDGTKILTAKTTTGQWVFSIPYAGTWTVTATDGTNTADQDVVISTEGQSESVTISYRIYLYDNGDLCTENSGGWNDNDTSGSLIVFEDDYIALTGMQTAQMFIHNLRRVPTSYTRMTILGEVISVQNNVCFQGCGLATSTDWSITGAAWNEGTVGTFKKTLDISNVTDLDDRYVKIAVGLSGNCVGRIYQIYVE